MKTILISLLSLPILMSAQTMSSGFGSFFAICENQTVENWGVTIFSQPSKGSYTPISVDSLKNVIAVATGASHCLALKSDSTVWAWGSNNEGQLGDGTPFDKVSPIQVQLLTGIIAIAAASNGSLALKKDGTVWVWGNSGGLGNGTSNSSKIPVKTSIADVTAIAAGTTYSLALKRDGTVWAWGNNNYGQLGTGSWTSSTVPVQVKYLSNIIAITAYNHSFALENDGTVWGWGFNTYGELGDGTNIHSNIPKQIPSLANVTAVSSGGSFSLALKNDGTLWSWGRNTDGELGNGTNKDSNVPITIPTLRNAKAISGGYYNAMVLQNDGSLWTWGQYGNRTSSSNVPVHIRELCKVATSENELANNEPAMKIFPNPSTKLVTISINNLTEQCTIHIINSLGKLVYSDAIKEITITNSFTKEIDLSALASGIYYVMLQPVSSNGSQKAAVQTSKKLILQ